MIIRQLKIIAAVTAIHIVSSTALSEPTKLTVQQWREDLGYLLNSVESTHPDPYRWTSRAEFRKSFQSIYDSVPDLSDIGIALRLSRLVALLEDGHTGVTLNERFGLDSVFGVRFYRFRDGLFITAIEREFAEFVGARVLKIGGMDADHAHRLCAELISSDNQFGALEHVFYLSYPAILRELGICETSKLVELELELDSGARKTIALTAHVADQTGTHWWQWGEMYAPDPNGIEYVTAFEERAPNEYRVNDTALPLHLRYRLPYIFYHLPEKDAVYFQMNFTQRSWEDESFEDFYTRMFAFIDRWRVKRFIIDLRYNGGGDGSIVKPFVHEIIKRDSLNQPGRLFTLVGRKTFSAGIMFLNELVDHTETYTVGEPPGAGWNHFGDAAFGEVTLPHSGLRLSISTLYWQLTRSDDTSRIIKIDAPAQFSSHEYFSGADPALELALADTGFYSISDLVYLRGGKFAEQEYEQRVKRWGRLNWWRPFRERDMNSAGYELLRFGRTQDALAAFRLNTRQYPGSWNVWDSYGEALLNVADTAGAKASYRESLRLNPGNANAGDALARLGADK